MASFVIIEPGHPERLFNIDKPELIIGREPSAMLRLSNVSVSRKHAKLVLDELGVSIEDLGSQNGTLVNGTRLEHRCALRTPDEVQVGKFTLVFYGDERTTLEHKFQGTPLTEIPLAYGLRAGAMQQTATFQLSPALLERLRSASDRMQRGRVVLEGRLGSSWEPGNKELTLGVAADIPAAGFPWWGKKAAVAWNGNRHVLRRLTSWARVEVNGQPVTEKMLGDGDRFRVGSSFFRYQMDKDASASGVIPFEI